MSQTQTTVDSVTYEPTSVRQILQVYNIHQTAGPAAASGTSGWSVDSQWHDQPQRQNWASEYNRIPPYREPSRSHRYFGRPAGRDWGEASFIVMMFSGVYVVSVRALCPLPGSVD
jgi:hypothetical protein